MIDDFLKIFTDDEAEDFVAISVREYLKSIRKKTKS